MNSTAVNGTALIRRTKQRIPVKFVNIIGRHVRRLGSERKRFDPENMCQEAERRTGLDDFGDESFREPLTVLLDAIRREAHLHTIGWQLMRRQIIGRLCVRLGMQAYWKHRPEVLENQIARPLVIIGLPRTGTTFLFYLLAQDPAHRWLPNWEALNPVPPRSGPDQRRNRAIRINRVLDWLVPEMRRKHAFAADNPSECFHLLLATFETEILPFIIDIPSYRTWLYGRNRLPAYRFYRNQLHVLQNERPRERWLLKTPFHIFNLDILLSVFPDACIVHTHRDPAQALPSTCSLEASFRDLYAERINYGELGRETVEHFACGMDRCLKVRAKAEASHFCDVDYRTLVREPMTVVERIYRQFSFPLSSGAIAQMHTYLADNPQGKHGAHRYSLEDFGLDAETVRIKFKRYSEQFGIDSEAHRTRAHA
jgi:Sulfotransferase family